MRISVSVAIMAHPARADMVPTVIDALDAPATVVWDDGSNSRWGTGSRALRAYDKDATHHLVIQDDAIACKNLVAGLTKALTCVPERTPVGLYVGGVRPMRARISAAAQRAREEHAHWLILEQILWGVGLVIPTDVIDEAVRECDRLSIANYDSRLATYFTKRGIPCWYTWPSLVEHRDSPSLVPNRTAKRHAHSFLGVDKSAAHVKWSDRAVDCTQGAVRPKVIFRNVKTGHTVAYPARSSAAARFRKKPGWIEEKM